jgi:hypothetical protein
MYLGNNAAIRGCQEYFNRCAAAGSPIGATQTPSAYDNAASFNGTNQFLSIPSNSTLTVTGTSFTYAFWANTPNTSNGMVISKTSGSDTREFQISLNTGGVAEFRLFSDGTFANSRVISSSASSFSANSWNFFAYRYDSSAATIGISVNGGAFTTLGSIPAITQTNTNPLNLGVFVNTSGGLNYTGQLASVGFWKRALTASEVSQLWNSGAGRTYASLDTGLRNNLISWWALNGTSTAVSLTDSHTGGNNLTNTGSVTAPTIGPVVTALSDPRQLIIDFAQGIDRLGLWNSMVCWPLRSSQNGRSGTTAFSLGGLGRFDGTLTGTPLPSWTADGVTFGASTQFIQYSPNFNVDFTLGGYTVYAVWSAMGVPIISGELPFDLFSSIDAPFSLRNTISTGVLGGTTWLAQSRNYNGNRYYQNSGGQQPTSGNAAYGWNADTLTLQRDGADLSVLTAPSSTPTNGAYTMRTTGRNNSTTSATSRISHLIAMAPNIGMTASRMAQIHALYRQTLGLGLGLP